MNRQEEEPAVGGPLAGCGVLVTRPAPQAADLCRKLAAAGAVPIGFPVLAIAAPQDPAPLDAAIERLAGYHWAIFVSANAVEGFMPRLLARRVWPTAVRIAVVGAGSARALARYDCPAPLVPAQGAGSEHLLAAPPLQDMAGQRVLILRGNGGRELLAEALRSRGAAVEYVAVYRRVAAPGDIQALMDRWTSGAVQIVTVHNAESLDRLYARLDAAGRSRLCNTPLVVVSPRLQQRARALGVQAPVLVAEDPSDEAVIQAIERWHQQQERQHD